MFIGADEKLSLNRCIALHSQLSAEQVVKAQGESGVTFLEEDGQAIVTVDGVIADYSGYASAKDMRKALNEAKGRDVTVRVNSPGGSVFEGFSMMNQLRQYKGDVNTETDGLAASAAALVFLAGEKREMSEVGAQVMIHEAWNVVIMAGNKREMRDFFNKQFNLLDRVDGDIAKTIAKVSSLSESEAMSAMEAETWYGADEAVEAGIATGTIDSGSDPANTLAGVAPGISKGDDFLAWLRAEYGG